MTILKEEGKCDIKTIANPLEIIVKINGVTYTRERDGHHDAGVLISDCEEVFGISVKSFAGGEKYAAFSPLIALLIESVKELNGTVKAQQAKIVALEKKVKK